MNGYTTGANNRLLADPTHTYQYDNEGNRTRQTDTVTGQTTDYEWDHRNRLTRAVVKDSNGAVLRELKNTYDVFNRRIGRWFDADGAGPQSPVQTWTAYDGANPYADFNGAGALTTRYLYGQAIDQLFARVSAAGDVDWYLTDNLGSVRQIAHADGTIADALTYDSYGNILSETNLANGDRFKFTTREWEPAINLDLNGGRWYDPAAGRYVGENSNGITAGDPNPQRYAHNSPLGNYAPLTGSKPPIGDSDLRGSTNAVARRAAPGFWSDYWFYLTNPSRMDDDMREQFEVSGSIAIGAGIAAGGLAIAGADVAISIGGAYAAASEPVIVYGVAGGTAGVLLTPPGASTSETINNGTGGMIIGSGFGYADSPRPRGGSRPSGGQLQHVGPDGTVVLPDGTILKPTATYTGPKPSKLPPGWERPWTPPSGPRFGPPGPPQPPGPSAPPGNAGPSLQPPGEYPWNWPPRPPTCNN